MTVTAPELAGASRCCCGSTCSTAPRHGTLKFETSTTRRWRRPNTTDAPTYTQAPRRALLLQRLTRFPIVEHGSMYMNFDRSPIDCETCHIPLPLLNPGRGEADLWECTNCGQTVFGIFNEDARTAILRNALPVSNCQHSGGPRSSLPRDCSHRESHGRAPTLGTCGAAIPVS